MADLDWTTAVKVLAVKDRWSEGYEAAVVFVAKELEVVIGFVEGTTWTGDEDFDEMEEDAANYMSS